MNEDFLTPDQWFEKKYPALIEVYGIPIECGYKDKFWFARYFTEDFMAATLGELGAPQNPIVYYVFDQKFYAYDPEKGIYQPISDAGVEERISQMFLLCSRECYYLNDEGNPFRVKWRNSGHLRGVVNKARGILAKGFDFFHHTEGLIPLKNGVLQLSDMTLMEYSPARGIRSQLPVVYDPKATCPKFLEYLNGALPPDDIEVLQKWAGLVLWGRNLSQKILILMGVAGSGKGTFVRIVTGILGRENVVELRTAHLGERFEVARFVGSKLLYGADVKADFLSGKHVPILKSLVGGDPLTPEVKNSNNPPQIMGEFNVLITSNSKLYVNIESDVDAWRRRLIVIKFGRIPDIKVADLSNLILREEGSGILNWMIAGAMKLREEEWLFNLSAKHQEQIDEHLLASESPRAFIKEKVEKSSDGTITSSKLFLEYQGYCFGRGWTPFLRIQFGAIAEREIESHFGCSVRHDVSDDEGKQQKGWKGIRLK